MSVLNQLAMNASFTAEAIIIDASSYKDSREFLKSYENYLAIWATVMDKKEAIVKNQAGNIVKIPAQFGTSFITDTTAADEPKQLLWFANTHFNPVLLGIAQDLMEKPRRAGVVRLSDELQVIQSDASKVLNPGHTMQESCTWVRSQFWHPQDLIDFRRKCKQELTPNGSSIEFTWRSFDPALGMDDLSPGNWLQITTKYLLFDGKDGDFYQLGENLGLHELS